MKIVLQGFADGEWFNAEFELEDASIDVTVGDGRWNVSLDREQNLDVSWQGGRAADRATVRPVSQNHVVMMVDRSRRREARKPEVVPDGTRGVDY